MKLQLTGAEIIIECLLEQSVDTVFGYPGGAILNVYDALYRYSDKIKHVLTSHEQGASHAVYQFFGKNKSYWNYIFADIVLTCIPVVIVYMIGQKYIVGGMTSGAVKE